MKKLIRAILVVTAASGLLMTSVVGAQSSNSGNGFRISPVRVEQTIEKGKSTSVTITVENPTAGKTIAKPVVNDFVASTSENGEPLLITDNKVPTPRNSFKSLVGPISEIELEPKQRKEVTVKISVPQNARAGGYYGAIRFIPMLPNNTTGVGLTASVGTIFLVRVPGDLTEKLDLVQFSASQNGKAKSFMTSGDVSIMVRLKNTGDIHVKPFGKVVVKDMFGKQVASYELNNTDPRANVLPDSIRKFEDKLPKRKWFGRYTATANLAYSDNGGDLISTQTTFWYLPTWFLITLVALVGALAAVIYWFIRRFKARHHHHSSKRT